MTRSNPYTPPQHSGSVGTAPEPRKVRSRLVVGAVRHKTRDSRESFVGSVLVTAGEGFASVGLAVLWVGVSLITVALTRWLVPHASQSLLFGVGAATICALTGAGFFARKRYQRRPGTGSAELSDRGIRLALPGTRTLHLDWDSITGYMPRGTYVQLVVKGDAKGLHAIPTPTPEEQADVNAFLNRREILRLA